MNQGDFIWGAPAAPKSRVKLVCGPPGSGKRDHVKQYAKPSDVVLDLDAIVAEFNSGDGGSSDVKARLLDFQTNRLAALSKPAPDSIVWIILSDPSATLRDWWRVALAVRKDDVILLTPSREDLYRNAGNDAARRDQIDQWIKVENENYVALKPSSDRKLIRLIIGMMRAA